MATPIENADWTLEITFANGPGKRRVRVEHELILGYSDPTQLVFTGLDLQPFGGIESGVSRQHAVIKWQGNFLVISDLDSEHGTLLNQVRLRPGVAYQLNDGDSLLLGQLKMTLRFNPAPLKSSIRAKRIDFSLETAPAQARGQRILVVEDDAAINQLYRIALEAAGFTVQICRDVVSAIRILNHQTPSLILLDLKLPNVHGIELCRYVRRDTECPTIPIVVASAFADAESVNNAMQAGADAFLSKPIAIKELVRVLTAVIYRHELEHPGASTKRLKGTSSLDFVATATRNDTLVIFVDEQREPIGVVVDGPITLGRGHPGAQSRMYVDLGNYGAFDKGVSRNHARIKRQGRAFLIEDLGSSNGTFVNGHSLGPNEACPIRNGDEVRLGDLRMHIYSLSDPEPSTPVTAKGADDQGHRL